MKTTATMKQNKAKTAAIGGAAIVVIAVLLFCLGSCSKSAEVDPVGTDGNLADVAFGTEKGREGIAVAGEEELAPETEEAEAPPEETEQPEQALTAQSTNDSGGSSALTASAPQAKSSVQSPAPSSSGSQAAPQKKWVEDTQQVWVEDKAAWPEQVPVYSSREVSICNICGANITGNTSSHGKAHMLAGEGSGHHSEVRREITGYDTVNHATEGQWDTKVVGGHWE